MAEQSTANRKAQLIAELEQARVGLGLNARSLRGDLDVGTHLKQAFLQRKGLWIGGAAITGWLLTKLPSRKKQKPPKYIYAKNKEAERSGLILTAMGLAGTLLRPIITSYATQKITELASRKDFGSIDHQRVKRESPRV